MLKAMTTASRHKLLPAMICQAHTFGTQRDGKEGAETNGVMAGGTYRENKGFVPSASSPFLFACLEFVFLTSVQEAGRLCSQHGLQ